MSGILLIGGPPCQPWSKLGHRNEAQDFRAAEIEVFCNLKRSLAEWCQHQGKQFRFLLENVFMSSAAREYISTRAGTQPVALHAADFG